MSYHRQDTGIGNPWAYIVDAAAQTTGTSASIIAGSAQKAERNAKRGVQAKALELSAEQTVTGAAITSAQMTSESARAAAETAAKSIDKKTKILLTGAAGIGALALLGLVVLR